MGMLFGGQSPQKPQPVIKPLPAQPNQAKLSAQAGLSAGMNNTILTSTLGEGDSSGNAPTLLGN